MSIRRSDLQSPYMIESAHDYIRAARLLWNQPNLCSVSVVNAAIGLEIILKSFVAQPSQNERMGTISEQYEINGKRFHKLTDLAKKIDESVYKKLRLDQYEHWFESFDNLFIEARYPYEPEARTSYSEVPITIGEGLLSKVIQWYKESGSTDPWIKEYPNVPLSKHLIDGTEEL